MLQKKSENLAKSPAEYLLDVFYNFGYNIVSMYIYITTTMINLPNSTLETIIPEKDGCHLLLGDKTTCKKKIKCLFKKCTILEDKTGYILDYKKMQEDKASRDQRGGLKKHLDESCEYKSVSCNPHEKTNYDKRMPMSLLPFLTSSSKEGITTEAKKLKDKILPLLSKVNQIKFVGGNYKLNMVGGADRQNRNSLAQSNMLYKIVKDHMNIKGAYKFLLLMKMMEIVYGDVSEQEFHIEESREDEKKKLFNKKPEVVHIPFPFEHALLDTPAERLECLMVHLLGETPEDFDNNPTLKTCFSCKSCTLMGQSSKVIRGLYEELVNGVNLTFSQIFDTLFSIFSKAMTISNITSEKLAIQMLLNYRLNHRAVNIRNLRDELSPNHNYSDALLMIPKMSIKNGVDVENNDIFKQNRYVYAYLKSMGMDRVLTFYLYDNLYLEPSYKKYENKRMSMIKKRIRIMFECIQTYTGKNKDSISGVMKKIDERVESKHIEYLREHDFEKDDGLLHKVLTNEEIDREDEYFYRKYEDIYRSMYQPGTRYKTFEEVKPLVELLA